MATSPQQSLKVFISYSHRDSAMKEEIERRLRAGIEDAVILSDVLLEPGSDWSKVLTGMRNEADVFLLLVSEAYLNSTTIKSIELPQVMKRGADDQVYVIPVILEDCNWRSHDISRYQALPKWGRPVSGYEDKEVAFAEIVHAVASIKPKRTLLKAFSLIKQEKETRSGTLNLTECNLSNIPRDILDMPWLKHLDLSKNYIKTIEHLDNLQDLS